VRSPVPNRVCRLVRLTPYTMMLPFEVSQNHILMAVGALVVLLLVRLLSQRKRANPLAALAKKLGLSLQEGHDDVLEHDVRIFSFSGLGRVFPRLYYALSCSKEGVRLKMFDYNGSRFAFGMPRFLFQTMGFGDVAGAAFPHFLVSPKTVYWRLRSLYSKDVFLREGIPGDFLKKYVIIVKKDMSAPKLHGEFFDTFLSLKKPYSLEARGSSFIFYRRSAVVPLRRMAIFFSDLQAVAGTLCRSAA